MISKCFLNFNWITKMNCGMGKQNNGFRQRIYNYNCLWTCLRLSWRSKILTFEIWFPSGSVLKEPDNNIRYGSFVVVLLHSDNEPLWYIDNNPLISFFLCCSSHSVLFLFLFLFFFFFFFFYTSKKFCFLFKFFLQLIKFFNFSK